MRYPTCVILLQVVQAVSAHLEGSIEEFYFTIPDIKGNFSDSVSWCETNNNSTLTVVNDSSTQMALSRFLNSSNLTSMVYINVILYQDKKTTWFLINGSNYLGEVRNQDLTFVQYRLYSSLAYHGDTDTFRVDASAPIQIRNYICEFEENMCSDGSYNHIHNGRCYVKYEFEYVTWYRARERCFNNGGDLAQFQAESWLSRIILFDTSWLNKSLTYWVGIRWKDLSWKPSDGGDEIIQLSWANGKPNNYTYGCVCMDPNGIPPWSWTDSDCNTQRKFVCLKKIPTSKTITSSKSTITVTVTAKPATQNCVIDENGVCMSICPQPSKSEAFIVGLVLGIGFIIPLIIIVLVLGVANVHLKRQLSEKSNSNKDVSNMENTTSISEDRTSTDAATPDTHYQHLHNNSRHVTMIPLYEQLNQP